MIGRVTFEVDGKIVKPQEDYGIFLKSYDVTPPKAKVYRVELAGADGSLDFTEWAGNVLYETRIVTVELRDMHGRSRDIRNFLLGRRVSITFSDSPDWFYVGRCDEIKESTRKRVTDLSLKFTCEPYRYSHVETVVSGTVDGTRTFALVAKKAPVVPVIHSTGAAFITVNGRTYNLVSGDNNNVPLKVTDTVQYRTVVNAGSGDITVTFRWRDGEL